MTLFECSRYPVEGLSASKIDVESLFRFSLLWDVNAALIGCYLLTFPNNISPIFMTLEHGIVTVSRNVGTEQSTLYNFAEEQRSHLHGGGFLESLIE
jgi:hypothetical protein